MENLEKALEKAPAKIAEERGPVEKPLLKETFYRGLRKIEERVYRGGTSIKYWM